MELRLVGGAESKADDTCVCVWDGSPSCTCSAEAVVSAASLALDGQQPMAMANGVFGRIPAPHWQT